MTSPGGGQTSPNLQLLRKIGREVRFGGAFRVKSVYGTEHVMCQLNMSGEVSMPQPTRKRGRMKAPMPVAVEPRSSPESEQVMRKLVNFMLKGPFNSLTSTVIKDLEGFAFGSNAFNAGKVCVRERG